MGGYSLAKYLIEITYWFSNISLWGVIDTIHAVNQDLHRFQLSFPIIQ